MAGRRIVKVRQARRAKQYRHSVIRYQPEPACVLLIFPEPGRSLTPMKSIGHLLAAAVLSCLALPASAACYADYKAKRDKPLRLHYGVMRIDAAPCTMSESVRSSIRDRLAAEGWQLLQVQSVFDDAGLDERKSDAGQYFLRY